MMKYVHSVSYHPYLFFLSLSLLTGEEYLKGLGFPEEVTSFVRNHVEAKRYLVATDPDYYEGKNTMHGRERGEGCKRKQERN